VGYDLACTLHLDGRATRGKALLEQHELVFRGAVRLAIPLTRITSATGRAGPLDVRFGARTATFDLGPAAAKWARRITNPPSRLDKLGIKPGKTLLVLSLPEDHFLTEAIERGAIVVKKTPSGGADLVFYGAAARPALERLPALVSKIKPDGAIWIVRPKGQPAITESDVMSAGRRAGLVDVKVVSFSDTLTAEKFVIPVAKRPPSRIPKKRAR
jgi:hypothetical protein